MMDYIRRRRQRLVDDKRQAAAETKTFFRRAEHLLVTGGLLAVAAGVIVLSKDGSEMPAAAMIVLGLGLFSGAVWRRAGWLLTAVALVLLVVDALV